MTFGADCANHGNLTEVTVVGGARGDV